MTLKGENPGLLAHTYNASAQETEAGGLVELRAPQAIQ